MTEKTKATNVHRIFRIVKMFSIKRDYLLFALADNACDCLIARLHMKHKLYAVKKIVHNNNYSRKIKCTACNYVSRIANAQCMRYNPVIDSIFDLISLFLHYFRFRVYFCFCQ